MPATASASTATLNSPPDGATYYAGSTYPWRVNVPLSASFSRDASCGATKVGGVQNWTGTDWSSVGGTSADTFDKTASVSAGDYSFRAWLDCGGGAYTVSAPHTIHVLAGNAPGIGDIPAKITAWVQNIIEQMKTKYDPCDYGAVAGGTPNSDCGQKGLKHKEEYWHATGSLVCATEVSHSYSGPFTPITTGPAVHKCIKEFPPGGEKRLSRFRRAGHPKSAQAGTGNYRGVGISLAGVGQSPTKKQLRRSGRALAAFLRSHKKPRNALPISFKVGKHGRSATFSPGLLLSCEDGSSLPIDLSDLPDPTAPLSVSRQGYFKLAAEDPTVTARIGGLFLNKRSLAGTFYLGLHLHQHGLCETLVGFAARRKG